MQGPWQLVKNAQLGNGQTAASGISAVQNALECFEYHFHKRQLIRANDQSEVQSSSDVRSSEYGGAQSELCGKVCGGIDAMSQTADCAGVDLDRYAP